MSDLDAVTKELQDVQVAQAKVVADITETERLLNDDDAFREEWERLSERAKKRYGSIDQFDKHLAEKDTYLWKEEVFLRNKKTALQEKELILLRRQDRLESEGHGGRRSSKNKAEVSDSVEVKLNGLMAEIAEKLSQIDLPKLETYKVKNDLLTGLFELSEPEEGPVCINPKTGAPYLLAHGLERCKIEGSDFCEFVTRATTHIPSALYATSGAGKTRKVFEFLSHHYGLYFTFVAENNPGSGDLDSVLDDLNGKTAELSKHKPDEWKKVSEANILTVRAHLETCILARVMVLKVLLVHLKDALTPYRWLLFQLHPTSFFPGEEDLFQKLSRKIRRIDGISQFNVPRYARQLTDLAHQSLYCFVDESQILLKKLDDRFVSSKITTLVRTAYSGFVKALVSIRLRGMIRYPVMIGTGLSLDALRSEMDNSVAKEGSASRVFVRFDVFSPTDVQKYIWKFVALKGVDAEVLNHLSTWLQGRPRWSAFFVSWWLQGKTGFDSANNSLRHSTRSIDLCTSKNSAVLDQLDSFLYSMTRIQSQNSYGRSSAFHALVALKTNPKHKEICGHFEESVVRYTMSGSAQILRETETATLIENGICWLKQLGHGGAPTVVLAEPIMVEAGVVVVGTSPTIMKRSAATQEQAKACGFVFEQLMVPVLREQFVPRFKKDIEKNLSIDLSDYRVGRSAYGVLARKCERMEETCEWLEKTASTKIEGSVPPFCFPDTDCGPDIIFLLRDSKSFKSFVPVLVQCKFLTKSSDATKRSDALRTIDPGLLYALNSGNEEKRKVSTRVSETLEKKLRAVLGELFFSENQRKPGRKRARESLRVLASFDTSEDNEKKQKKKKKKKEVWTKTPREYTFLMLEESDKSSSTLGTENCDLQGVLTIEDLAPLLDTEVKSLMRSVQLLPNLRNEAS